MGVTDPTQIARGIGERLQPYFIVKDSDKLKAIIESIASTLREADADGYRRGRSEADELFVLDVDCEFGSGCPKDRTCYGASHWLTVQQIEQRGQEDGK